MIFEMASNKYWKSSRIFSLSGSAAMLCGKALPFRFMPFYLQARLRLAIREAQPRMGFRKCEPESHRLSAQHGGRAAKKWAGTPAFSCGFIVFAGSFRELSPVAGVYELRADIPMSV
jgi:hypothetical protein